jgi:hypothetical protein
MTRAIELLFSLSKKTGCSLIPFWICSISKLSMPTTRFEQQPVNKQQLGKASGFFGFAQVQNWGRN